MEFFNIWKINQYDKGRGPMFASCLTLSEVAEITKQRRSWLAERLENQSYLRVDSFHIEHDERSI